MEGRCLSGSESPRDCGLLGSTSFPSCIPVLVALTVLSSHQPVLLRGHHGDPYVLVPVHLLTPSELQANFPEVFLQRTSDLFITLMADG